MRHIEYLVCAFDAPLLSPTPPDNMLPPPYKQVFPQDGLLLRATLNRFGAESRKTHNNSPLCRIQSCTYTEPRARTHAHRKPKLWTSFVRVAKEVRTHQTKQHIQMEFIEHHALHVRTHKTHNACRWSLLRTRPSTKV